MLQADTPIIELEKREYLTLHRSDLSEHYQQSLLLEDGVKAKHFFH